MKNLAIVLAVSKYNGIDDLPGCKSDGEAIGSLLEASKRFDDVLLISGPDETGSASVKRRLSAIIEKYSSQAVGEVFFYFTGHGEYHAGDVYLNLTGYDRSKRKQSGLSNREVDDLIRPLKPELYVKIIDACQSGATYIKDAEALREQLKSTLAEFKAIYFMFSSMADQPSFASEQMSYFTKSILEAIETHEDGPIRYKDIIDAVSDDFENSGEQTPLFVSQAKMTEVLCDVTQEIRDALTATLLSSTVVVSGKSETPLSLSDLLKREAGLYCTQQECNAALFSLQRQIEERNFVPNGLSEIFSQSVTTHDNRPWQSKAIGQWLEKNAQKLKIFAKPTTTPQTTYRRVARNRWRGLVKLNVQGYLDEDDEDTKLVTETRSVIDGYENTTDLPFQSMSVILTPLYASVTPEQILLAPVVSRTHIRLFYAFAHYESSGWEKMSPIGELNWQSFEVSTRFAAEAGSTLDRIAEEFAEFVLSPLQSRWNLQLVAPDATNG